MELKFDPATATNGAEDFPFQENPRLI
jgi:hypothetical protein